MVNPKLKDNLNDQLFAAILSLKKCGGMLSVF
jgi:hypothetical protein